MVNGSSRKILLQIFFALIALALSISPVFADAVYFDFKTANGAMANGATVSGDALFTLTNDIITVKITNIGLNPYTVGQNISDVGFTLNGGNRSTATIVSATGNLIAIARTGTVTGAGTLTASNTTWHVDLNSSQAPIVVATLNATNGPGNKQTIVGPASPGPNYTPPDHGGGSLFGNPGHDTYVDRSLTLTLHVAGVTTNSTISNVTFGFGTESGHTVRGFLNNPPPLPSDVPEPSTGWLLSAGAGLILVSTKKLLRIVR